MKRRTFMKGSLAGSVLAVAAGSGLLKPTDVLAAGWPKGAFDAQSEADMLSSLYGSSSASASGKIRIKAPIQAENGRVVPVKVQASLANVESIAVAVAKNPRPLATSVNLSGGATGYYSTRIKMGKTSKVTAYVKAGGKLHTASKTVKVTVGGCGG
ncbi:MAG TPA: thiosulfate oxidation carrier protein SoxY [Acidiferrobacteraceae bacterium]|nr:thiosulfate oxidation carrier protein SoxY [Acidiferrobacteraceae bacterium]